MRASILICAVLLTAGTRGKRHALPSARIMIHQPLAGMEGTAEEIMIHATEFKKVKAKLDTRTYATGIEVPDDEMDDLDIVRDPFHGDRNYTLRPRTFAHS